MDLFVLYGREVHRRAKEDTAARTKAAAQGARVRIIKDTDDESAGESDARDSERPREK